MGEETSTVHLIPFRHAVKKLPTSPSFAQLIEIYESLVELSGVREAATHNLLVIGDWMLVTPRPKGRKGILSENAAAMADMA